MLVWGSTLAWSQNPSPLRHLISSFEDRDVCQLFENEYDSDYRAIHIAINMGDTIEDLTALRYLLQKAD